MTRLFFVRHAEPDLSIHDDMLRGLSPKGTEDRKRVTDFLADKDISAVLSSPYKRAVDTVKHFADKYGYDITIINDFRERAVGEWIKDFADFTKKQWDDFSYRLAGGECLKEVQDRNIRAVKQVIEKYHGQNITIGSHGTALSTIINYYDPSFGYAEFERIKNIMPFIARFVFDENGSFVCMNRYEVL
ncbi:MAG: histidine phosphatase family protein [Oscillospiraceae bacterium]|nr:histidine phosphatase family protein [Oscillospiraceae bacterium]